MALLNYNRVYELTIGIPPTTATVLNRTIEDPVSVTFNSPPSFGSNLNEYRTVTLDGDAVLITDLDMIADIMGTNKSVNGSGVSSRITLYNLNKSTLNTVCRKNAKVILKAGYSSQKKSKNLPTIFIGQVVSFSTERQGTDVVTTLHCKDGNIALNSIRVSKSYLPIESKGGPLSSVGALSGKTIIDDLVEEWRKQGIGSSNETIQYDIPLPLARYPYIKPSDTEYGLGWSFNGYLKDAMSEICEHHGLVWYIHNSILYVQPKDAPKIRQILEIDDELIKSIQPNNEATVRDTANTKDNTGLVIKTFLNGTTEKSPLAIDKFVRITSNRSEKGLYKISSVSHNLDTRSSNIWDTTITCEKVS